MRGRRAPALPQAAPASGEEVLRIDRLEVEFSGGPARTTALRGVDLTLDAGRVLGLAGESGCGKTTSALAAMGLLSRGAVVRGSISYRGTELLTLPEKELRRYRGRHLAMIFQETTTALNPVIRVGDQLMMAARTHVAGSRTEARDRVLAALADVRLTDPERVMASYPHELSGGMCQRIIIAMALSCGSRILFADEPTTALDVSVQEEILELIRGLVTRRQLAVLMISHDLAVLADVCDDIAVMYRGEIVESGPAATVLGGPAHPYTQALLDCLPTLRGHQDSLPELPSAAGDTAAAQGCRYLARCPWATDACQAPPPLSPVVTGQPRMSRCWRSAAVLAHAARGGGGEPDGPGTDGAPVTSDDGSRG
ncbi:MAG TPA: ABC transporter ATP-binding protein [Trebonia sp.]|nr:ABC transporter ATP-binding protein [Trebonia sp.]